MRNLTETNTAAAISSSGTLTISDVDSAASFVAQAGIVGLYGTFAIDSAGAWTYAASSAHNEFAAGTTHTDTFSVASADGTLTSVTINIAGSNDTPVANAQSIGTDKDTAVPVTLSGSDVDGDSLAFTVLSGPAHGTLSGSGANRTYTPDPGYLGPDSFSYVANDGTLNSAAGDRQPERAPEHCARRDCVRPVGRARAGLQCVGPVLGHRRRRRRPAVLLLGQQCRSRERLFHRQRRCPGRQHHLRGERGAAGADHLHGRAAARRSVRERLGFQPLQRAAGVPRQRPGEPGPDGDSARLLRLEGTGRQRIDLFTANDANGDSLLYFFYDNSADPASGHFTVNGVVQAAGTTFAVTAAQLATTTFTAGTAVSDDLFVNVWDGSAFSGPKEFHVNVPANQAPTVTASNQTATSGQVLNASSLFTANDADGDSLLYFFYDNSAAPTSGHFDVNGVVQAAGTTFAVTQAQLAQTHFRRGNHRRRPVRERLGSGVPSADRRSSTSTSCEDRARRSAGRRRPHGARKASMLCSMRVRASLSAGTSVSVRVERWTAERK